MLNKQIQKNMEQSSAYSGSRTLNYYKFKDQNTHWETKTLRITGFTGF